MKKKLSKNNQTILTIDCGTQSLRAFLFSPKGDMSAMERMDYEPYCSPMPGWAEQDPEMFWNALCTTCIRLKKNHPDLFASIAGVGISTLRNSMINVDERGIPLRPAIMWMDRRKAEPVYFPNPIMKLGYKLSGTWEGIWKIQEDAKCNWICQNQPEVWKKTHKYLQVSGFLNFRLTGEFTDSIASQIGYIPFDYKHMKWADKYSLPAKMFPIEHEKLPDLVKPGEVLGYVNRIAADQTGIPKGTPVIACGSDKGCETTGMGVLNEHTAGLSFGTTATVQTTTKKYREPIRFMPPYPSPIPGCYNPEVEIFRGFWMITWFKNEFAQKEIEIARKKGIPAEIIMNEMLRETPPGAMGLVVQPYWSPGLKTPSAKGAMIGFGDVHKKAHVYRAVIEGLCFGLLDGLRKIEKVCGWRMDAISVAGGASQSDEICQISADIFDRPLIRGKTHETSGLGAAIVTSVGTGIHPGFDDAIRNMIHKDRVFEPIPEHSSLYKNLFERVYKKIYRSLSPLYEEIREITNFPEKQCARPGKHTSCSENTDSN